MNRIVKIKNTSGSSGVWVGRTIANGEYITLNDNDLNTWTENSKVFTDIGAGNLIVNKGADTTDDITNPTIAWNWLLGDILPYSKYLTNKLAVHSSPKPEPDDADTYVVWAGAGDDINQPDETLSIGAGDTLAFDMTYGTPIVTRDIKFDPRHGRVWLHEAYLKFENGGVTDYLMADIVAPATPLQQVTDLTCIIENNWVKYAVGSPTGTHGFAGTPVLIPRTFAHDGDWDYDGVNLTPNLAGTGEYKISAIERTVHRYFNKIPLYGSSTTYFTMSSDETAELPVIMGYFIRISVYNNSNSNWNISIIIEMYRQRTVYP